MTRGITLTMADGSQATDRKGKDPTADYRKYPKGPDFKLIVALFCVTILVVLLGGWLFLKINPKVVPSAHGPQPASKSLSTPAKDGH